MRLPSTRTAPAKGSRPAPWHPSISVRPGCSERLAVVPRGAADDLTELAGEIALVGEAVLGRDGGDRLVGVHEGAAGRADAHALDVLPGGEAVVPAEAPLEGALRQSRHPRQLRVVQRLAEVVADVAEDAAQRHAVPLLAAGLHRPRDAGRADDPAAGVAQRQLERHAPPGRVVEAADQLDPVGDGLAAQDPLVVRPELTRDVSRQQIEICLAEDVLAPAQSQAEEVRRVDPPVTAGPVLDPEDDVLEEIEQLADGPGGPGDRRRAGPMSRAAGRLSLRARPECSRTASRGRCCPP